MPNKMKKLVTIVVLLISSKTYSQKNAVISGEIKNNKSDSIGIAINNPVKGERQQHYKSKIDSNGKFKIVVPLIESLHAILMTSKSNIMLFISPNDSINCTYDENAILTSMNFEGNNAGQYNYFIKYLNDFGTPHGYFFKTDYSDVFNMNPVSFKNYRKEKLANDLLFLKNYSENQLLTHEFKQFAEIEIKYSYYYGLLSYYGFKKYFRKIEEKLPDDFYDEINGSLFNNDLFLNSDNYVQATKMYINTMNMEEYTTPQSFFPKAMHVSSEVLSGKTSYNYQLNTLLEMMQTDASVALKDSLTSSFLEKCPYDDYNIIITNNYKKNKAASNASIPQKTLKSVFETESGKETTLNEILKIYKNKVIYIDVWASWCGPCKVEMPYSMALKDKFKNENVVFMYLSVDKNKDAWKKAINNWKIYGEHYLIHEGIESEFGKHFNIHGVPHYILIDKNGKTIFPSAVRPSSKSIESSIRTLL
jgi:thiol-disulfide isomerase/thioredoxin